MNVNFATQAEIKSWLAKAKHHHLHGSWDNAEALYNRVLSNQPRHPDALHLLGPLLHQRGKPRQAIDLIGRAISINKFSPAYYVNRGVALLAIGMPEPAIEHFQSALKLKPGLAQAYLNMGNALRGQKKYAEAADSYRQAIKSASSLVEAYFNLGIVLQEQGDFERAAENFRTTIRLQPRRCDAYFQLSRCLKMTDEGEQLAKKIQALLQKGGIDDRGAAFCNFALGKIYDDLGKYDDAFRHYRQGNELEQKQTTFDREEHTRLVDWTIDTFTAKFFAAHKDFGSSSSKPVFIVGMPRSGTTLTEQIIASHSQVHGGGEIDYWLKQGQKFSWPEQEEMTRKQVNSLAETYLQSLDRMSGASEYFTDKMPYNFLRLGLIHLALPGAKIIHCMRNPADICLSIYFNRFTQFHGYSTNLEDLAFYYREYLRLMEHWRSVLPAETLQGIHYEQLVADQEKESHRLIASLGLEWEEQCLEYHQSRRVVNTPSKWQVRQPIYKDSVARWKRYLSHIAPLVPLAEEYNQALAQEADGKRG